MKKLKRTNSIGGHKESRKTLSQVKTNTAAVAKPKPKKLFRETGEKEKENMHFEDPLLKYARVQVSHKKKIPPKKTKRSKSLIFQRKINTKIDTTHNSSRLIQNLEFLRREETREETHLPINMGSIREVHYNQDPTPFGECSPLYNRNNQDFFSQPRQILIEDAEIQCQQFQFQDAEIQCQQFQFRHAQIQCEGPQFRHTAVQCQHLESQDAPNSQQQEDQREKQELRTKIRDLQHKMEAVVQSANQKLITVSADHKETTKAFNQKILTLKEGKAVLSREKQSLKEVVLAQQKEISIQRQAQNALQVRLKSEQASKQRLMKENDESKRQVEFYKKELACFEENLSGLQKMKKVYQKRLDELEFQKVKIKKHACELLQMVQKYKQAAKEGDQN